MRHYLRWLTVFSLEWPETDILWIILVAHVVFWVVIAVRLGVSHHNRRSADDSDADPSSVDVSGTVSSPWSVAILFLVSLTMGSYYVLLVLWWINPSAVGPRLVPLSLAFQIGGIGLVALGVVLMGWSYTVLHSFRLLAQIEPDHQLCTHGPYAWLRHPVYLGIDLFYLGSFLLLPHVGFLIQTLTNALAYDIRARIEEEVLQRAFGVQYHHYIERTYRLIPWLY
jgi:protein-S-isoprenylcysteine O-methyltransferase Ste14